jgi:glutathione S-transferase
MKLYYDPLSTSARAVSLFVYDEGIPVDIEPVELFAGDHLTDAFKAVNPNGQVPVLEDGGFRLAESAAILKYLADKAGSAAYPRDLQARARVNEAMDWFNTGFSHFFCYMGAYLKFLPELRALNPVSLADIERIGVEKSRKYLNVLDRHMLAGRSFVCGDDISLADYLGIAYASLGAATGFDFSRYPNVVAWMNRMADRKGWEPAYAAFNGFVSAMRAEPERVDALLDSHP